MYIINPIYDGAFKYLMQNEKLAKKLIGIILDQEVVELEYNTQEVSYKDEKRNFPVFRMDFSAVIKNQNGEQANVLIELQKANNPDPIIRFRKYLGNAYIKTNSKTDKNGNTEISAKEIITIYILGFNMPEYNCPAILVNNEPYNILTKEPISHKSEFIKMLTHKSYILFIKNINPKPNTRFEKLISFFDQSKKSENDYILDIDPNLYADELEDISSFLHQASQDIRLLKQLEAEQEIENHLSKLEDKLDKTEQKLEQAEQEKQKAKIEKQKAEQEKQKAEQEKQKAEQEKQKAEQEKQKAEQEKKALAYNYAKYLKSTTGIEIDDIIKITGLSKNEIEKL